jgi:hypothetical protein
MADFDPNVLGAYEIGVLVSVLLHGTFSLQIYHYFANFPNDPQGLKLTVSSLSKEFGDLI